MDGFYIVTIFLNTLLPQRETAVIEQFLKQQEQQIDQKIVDQQVIATSVKRGYWENPSIGSEFGHNIGHNEFEGTVIKGGIALPLGGLNYRENQMRRSGADQLQKKQNLNQFQKICWLRGALNRFYFTQQSLDVITQNLEQMKIYEEKIKTLIELQQIPGLTLKMFQLKHKLHRQEHRTIKQHFQIQKEHIYRLTSIKLTKNFIPEKLAGPKLPEPKQLNQHNRTIQLLDAIKQKELTIFQYTQKLNQPVLHLEAAIKYQYDTTFNPGYGVGFSLELPLFNRFKPEEAAAKSAYQTTLLRRQQQHLNLKRSIDTALTKISELKKSESLYNTKSDPKLIEEALLLFKQGDYQITDLAELILTLEAQKLKKIEWQRRYREAVLELQCQRGYFDPKIERVMKQYEGGQ